VIASVHLADVGPRLARRMLLARPARAEVPGLRYAEMTIAAPLSARLLPTPKPGRVGLIAAWDDDRALERFLDAHPLAAQLAGGWRVRLQPTRISGAWSQLSGLLDVEHPVDDEEPAAVLTLGRLRLTQTIRFLRASAAAEELAIADEAVLAATGLARPPRLVSTFSLWRSTAAMRAYATGHGDRAHLEAIRAHNARPFHHESAFVRLRPYAAHGSWDGIEPLATVRTRDRPVSV
jgi:hypothetical protein